MHTPDGAPFTADTEIEAQMLALRGNYRDDQQPPPARATQPAEQPAPRPYQVRRATEDAPPADAS